MAPDEEPPVRAAGRGGPERVTRAIRAPAEEIWGALTDPDVARTWLGEISPALEVGTLSRLTVGDGDWYALETFLMEPPRRLQYGRRRFGVDAKETIDWTVAPGADGCLVTVTCSAPEPDDDRRSAEHEEWLCLTDRLAKSLAGVPLPAAPPDREFLLSTDLPGSAASVFDHLTSYLETVLAAPPNALAEEYRTTLSLGGGDEPSHCELVGRADPATSSVFLDLDHATWVSPTSARLVLRERAQGTRLTVRHRGWEGAAFDDESRVRHRRRFAGFWHRFFLRFTLEYAQSWQIPTLSAGELNTRMDRSEVFLFDANRATLWTRGHIPRAVFVGQEDIPVDRLPSDKAAELVFYCRDTMCLTAYLSAAQARTLGYPNTFVMEGGRRAWAESGLPLVPEDRARAVEPEPTDAMGA